MPENLTIRPALEGDLPEITAIYADAVSTGTASYELQPPDIGEMKRRWRTLIDNGYPYLVAVRGGKVAGYAYAGPYRPRPAYRHTVESTVYIAADARRAGIGRELMSEVIRICEAADFRQMIAIIGDGDNHRASAGLHLSLGFRRVGVVEGSGYKFGRWLDTLIMQRPLGQGTAGPPARIR